MFENSIDLFESLVHLREGRVVEPGTRQDPPGLWSVGAFHADSDGSVHADHWERHPEGQELLFVLSGELAVHLRDHGRDPVTTLTSGQAFVVPAGQWHRLSVREPGDLVSITPRPGTDHEQVSTGEG